MNRRGFLWAVGAAGLAMLWRGPVVGAEASTETMVSPPARTPVKRGEAKRLAKTETLIRQALRERRTLQFRYHGLARQVEPHALGVAAEDRPALLAWQFEGGSESEPPPGWRTFFVIEMERVKLGKATFVVRANYDPKKTKLKAIAHEVARE